MLCPVMRVLTAFVVMPRMMRTRRTGTGSGCALRFGRRALRLLRSQSDERRSCEYYGNQNLFHLLSPQRKFPLRRRAYTIARKSLGSLRIAGAETFTRRNEMMTEG